VRFFLLLVLFADMKYGYEMDMKKDSADRHAKLNAWHTHAQFMSRYHHVVRSASTPVKEFSFYLDSVYKTVTQFALFLKKKFVSIFLTCWIIKKIYRVPSR